jgi:tetratricopeptide (TPR) repeat protein
MDFSDIDVPADTAADDSGGGFDFPEGTADSGNPEDFENPPDSENPADFFDSFNPEGEDTGFVLPDEAESTPADFSDDFSLSGLDDIFTPPAGSGLDADLAAMAAKDGDTPEVEEINLTEDEFARLQQSLASYPLNLRIALEEIIAEQVVDPAILSALIKMLVRGGSFKEAASQAGKILGRTISIPRGFEKKTGEALEAEQNSFAYIFVHKFLPVLRLFFIGALVAASLFYLIYQFIYIPNRARNMYQIGYERIAAGEYERANDRFNEAFKIHRVKDWFYKYAEAFRDERQYIYAEEKYDDLLRFYPRDKKGALDYANLETNYLRNYSKADRILRTNILDFAIDDPEGLLAQGDNNMAWGEIDPSRYENAREAYARLLERYGWTDPVVERMMLYFIRTDNLAEVLPLQQYFDEANKRKITAASLAELGGYLLDKQTEEVQGVPDENIERIGGLRDLLLRAVRADPSLPESLYHLARYYDRYGNAREERQTLESAIRTFDNAREETPRRTSYRIDTERRYAETLIRSREFFAAEEHLAKGIGVYEDALNRRLLSRSPEYGRLYANMGDLEYFTKAGDMEAALRYYLRGEENGWAPPEIQYRIGSAYYQLRNWGPALDRFFAASSEMPMNRRLLHALGNVSYQRGNYYAAQGYYQRLLDLLDSERARFPVLTPNDRPDHMELAERMMITRNNLGVAMEALANRPGNARFRSQALGLYAESARAWDAMTRNPQTMIRSGAGEFSTPGINLAYLNSRNILYPQPDYEPQIYLKIDKDVLEPSTWEELAPSGSSLAAIN